MSTPREPAPVEVKALRRKHRDWQIFVDDDGVWFAILRPTQTAQHILVGPGFEQLAARLAEADK